MGTHAGHGSPSSRDTRTVTRALRSSHRRPPTLWTDTRSVLVRSERCRTVLAADVAGLARPHRLARWMAAGGSALVTAPTAGLSGCPYEGVLLHAEARLRPSGAEPRGEPGRTADPQHRLAPRRRPYGHRSRCLPNGRAQLRPADNAARAVTHLAPEASGGGTWLRQTATT